MQEIFSSCKPLVLCFQATGMELNLSKNVISCGDPGMTCSLLGLIIKLLLRDEEFLIVWLCLLSIEKTKKWSCKAKGCCSLGLQYSLSSLLMILTAHRAVRVHNHLAFRYDMSDMQRINARGIQDMLRCNWGSARKSNESTLRQAYKIFNSVSYSSVFTHSNLFSVSGFLLDDFLVSCFAFEKQKGGKKRG